jgi:hypothetical protein
VGQPETLKCRATVASIMACHSGVIVTNPLVRLTLSVYSLLTWDVRLNVHVHTLKARVQDCAVRAVNNKLNMVLGQLIRLQATPAPTCVSSSVQSHDAVGQAWGFNTSVVLGHGHAKF